MKFRNLIVIKVDGGICSQIAFVSLGLDLQLKFGSSATVKYDLDWYDEFGKDKNKKFVRNWDFPKAFPGIALPRATKEEIMHLSRNYRFENDEYIVSDTKAHRCPAYICGYPERIYSLVKMRKFLIERFNPLLSNEAIVTARLLSAVKSCAVHVRRGDLVSYDKAYGYPTSIEYFLKAIAIVRGLEPTARFFFFSDEPDFVRSSLIPRLPNDIQLSIMDGNGSDKGYVDLYLISHCDYIISSIGSLGVFAAYLAPRTQILVASRLNMDAFRYLPNVIYLNDDRRFLVEQHNDDLERDKCIISHQLYGFDKIRYKLWKHFGKRLGKNQ